MPKSSRTLFALVLVAAGLLVPSAAAAADPCAPLVNPVACENSKPGTPSSTWGGSRVGGAGRPGARAPSRPLPPASPPRPREKPQPPPPAPRRGAGRVGAPRQPGPPPPNPDTPHVED